ncbi:putative damage-inducible protein DinB [Paenibacillus tundrae]|uniref:Damage-inducible protein DinB n=1 Tax=Paenibacillus tundrae TaxID=528187 RepID=A0ABT9WB84_9BACL|nr:putative damage-inducible protein DinB [Paenibacillus tundrae]
MIQSAFKHIDVAVTSLIDICDQLSEQDLKLTPIEGKRPVGELLSHLSVICRADVYISEGASEEDMAVFYEENKPHTLCQIKQALVDNQMYLYQRYRQFNTEELLQVTDSYWGASYSRLEWLLEIMGHVYHHRGQLYTMLNMTGKDLKVELFE